MALETERLLLTEWCPEDWRAFRYIATDPEVMRYINDGQPWPDERIRSFVMRQIDLFAARRFCLWKLVLKETGALIGFCGLQPLGDASPDIEIGWWLARDCWGRGLAIEAAREAQRDGFERVGLRRIVSIARPENHRSIRTMEKLGMSYEADVAPRGIPVVMYSRGA